MSKSKKPDRKPVTRRKFTKALLKTEFEARRILHERARERLHLQLGQLIADLGTDHKVRPVPLIQSDVKAFSAFYAKALTKREHGAVHSVASCFDAIHDVTRARIICQTQDDRDRLMRMLDRDDVGGMFADRSAAEIHDTNTNDRGYRALHYDITIDVPQGAAYVPVICELQLCTALQFAWGLYTHGDVYKSTSASPLLKELMRDLSDALAVSDAMASRLLAALEHSK